MVSGQPPLLIRGDDADTPAAACSAVCMANHMDRHRLDPHYTALERALAHAINHTSAENRSNTPDFVLAKLLAAVAEAFGDAVAAREKWYGVHLYPGAPRGCPPCPDGLDEQARRGLVVERLKAALVDGGVVTSPALVEELAEQAGRLAQVCEQLAFEGLLSKARW